MTQIIVQLNPDVPPTGSDLGIVNAARKSFGKRSDWCRKDLSGDEVTWFEKNSYGNGATHLLMPHHLIMGSLALKLRLLSL